MARGQRFIAARRLVRIGLAVSLLVLATGLSATSAYAAAPVPSVQFRMPFVGGQDWRISQGWDNCGSHCSTDPLNRYAYDLVPAATHLPIIAVADGVVNKADGTHSTCYTTTAGLGKENIVRIKHADNTYSVYVHMTNVYVTNGQTVKQGQIIGTSGCTGYTYSGGNPFEHLHFSRQWLNGSAYTSMKTSFVDENASGTLSAPVALPANAWYTSLNPCSQSSAAPAGDAYAIPSGKFCGRYYRDKTLDNPGTTTKAHYWSAMSRIDSSIGFSWGSSGFPEDTRYDPYFTASTFSARWIGRFTFSSGTWRFDLKASDGIRLYIDNMTTPVYASWTDRSTTLITSVSRSLSSGSHIIMVEYYNAAPGAPRSASVSPAQVASASHSKHCDDARAPELGRGLVSSRPRLLRPRS